MALGKLNNQTPLIVYGSALVASFLANTTMHPLDTMKVRRIALKSRRKIEERDSLDELDHGQQQQDQEQYEPTMNEIIGEGGFMSLYDGLGPNLAKEGVPLTIYLGVYESVKLYLLDNTTFFNEHVILCYLVAGGCGEFIASFIQAPAGGEIEHKLRRPFQRRAIELSTEARANM